MNLLSKHNAVSRQCSHHARISQFNTQTVLDPERIVNRALYGTDYDPDEVRLPRFKWIPV